MADKGQNPAVKERREGLMERWREVGGGEIEGEMEDGGEEDGEREG